MLILLYSLLPNLKGKETEVYFIDSTSLKTYHIMCEKQNKVFKEIAEKSKSIMTWFYNFKLHLIINDEVEIVASTLTSTKTK